MEEQVLPEPTPTTVMGLHVRPSRTFKSLRSTPMAFKISAPAEEEAYIIAGKESVSPPHPLHVSSNIAHTGMVLVQQASVGEPPSPPRATLTGVATARRGRARMANEARRENILVEIRGLAELQGLFGWRASEFRSTFYLSLNYTKPDIFFSSVARIIP